MNRDREPRSRAAGMLRDGVIFILLGWAISKSYKAGLPWVGSADLAVLVMFMFRSDGGPWR